ncbi:uncharacterized protein KIAA2013 homolog isoform X2 [Babylonia areolata]|uniref:uncharacterized protein KIAA2013 homolog isoform X2 n=1 Tax=Babylonia areolata TaxID=304850 RepID=UPI003FD5FA50
MKDGFWLLKRLFLCIFGVLPKATLMWIRSTIQAAVSSLGSLNRSRKVVLIILFVLALFYYLVPYFFGGSSTTFQPDTVEECLEERLSEFHTAIGAGDAFVQHERVQEGETHNVIYVGNGRMAVSVNSANGLFIRLNRALSLPVKYWPLVFANIKKERVLETNVLDIRSGLAYKIQAVRNPSGCIHSGSQVYAHRSRPSYLVQDIRIQNPTKYAIQVEFDQVGASGWTGAVTEMKQVSSQTGQTVQYRVSRGLVEIPESESVVAVAIGSVVMKDTAVTILPGTTQTYHLLTVVHYTKPAARADAEGYLASLVTQVDQDMSKGLGFADKHLRQQHTRVWGKLWESGFSISHSKAAGMVNGDKVNRTLYYVLSNVPAPMHDLSTSKKDRAAIEKVLHYPDRCYQGHYTIDAETLWIEPEDEDEIARVVTTWMITLEKHGCEFMVQAGAEGVLQAMILSLGALHFHNQHLELNMDPRNLHRDFVFRRLNYGNNTHVNISVTVGDDNKASIYVSLDRNDRPYYACDAGCLDMPVQLSNAWQRFPVKLTEPLTGILYITADKQHMEELKHSIHVKEIKEAPAHEHHVLALHKHGHHFGGLPTLFWVSIAFLIIIFHMFLFKLIYNEYCQGQERYRSRYNL